MAEKDLKERCYEDMYPPRFIVQVSGERDSPKVHATFQFIGSTRELQSQLILECYTGKYCV